MKSTAKPSGANVARGEFISVLEAEKRYPFSKGWIYNRIKADALPFPYTNLSSHKTVIDTADIEDWIKSRKVTPGG